MLRSRGSTGLVVTLAVAQRHGEPSRVVAALPDSTDAGKLVEAIAECDAYGMHGE